MNKNKDVNSGMALVLIFMLIGFFSNQIFYYQIAIAIHIINMVCPKIFRYFGVLWYAFSRALGSIMSKIILSIIFYLIVFPVGMVRKLLQKDSLGLKKWKTGSDSYFNVRNCTYKPSDIDKPY